MSDDKTVPPGTARALEHIKEWTRALLGPVILALFFSFLFYDRLSKFGLLAIFLMAITGILIAAWISASVDED